MGILEKAAKRSAYPVKLTNGETVHVRAMTLDQLDVISEMEEGSARTGYLLGCCLCSELGQPEFEILANENAAAFGARVMAAFRQAGVGTDTVKQITAGIGRIGKVDAEDIAGN